MSHGISASSGCESSIACMLNERVLQETPRAKQSRADRPDRDVERGRNFLVRHSFHVNQLHHDAIRFRERTDHVANCRSELQLFEEMIDSRLVGRSMGPDGGELLDIRIVAYGLHDRVTSDACAMNVSTDRDQPAPAVGSWGVRAPEPIGAQQSVLREIIAVRDTSREHARESSDFGEPSQRLVTLEQPMTRRKRHWNSFARSSFFGQPEHQTIT